MTRISSGEAGWLIYGANGYTGRLIAAEAKARGLDPILAGRSANRVVPLARELGMDCRCFDLRDMEQATTALRDVALVLNCAGPFSSTAAPMIAACLETKTHYLDITGEISVFEYAHALDREARAAGAVICPGVGFDVVPTDCVAAALKEALPEAIELALGFDSRSAMSPGTAKTSIESLALGGRIRTDGVIRSVPLAYRTRTIDFGAGEKRAMSIPWGDVATAFYTTGIPNIEVYVPASPRLIARLRRLERYRFLLRLGAVQWLMKRSVDKRLSGPDDQKRKTSPTRVWGEAKSGSGDRRTARIEVANGYSLTATASVRIAERLSEDKQPGGFFTPSMLTGADFVTTLPGSGRLEIT